MQHVFYRLHFSNYFTLLQIDNTRAIALWRSFQSREYQSWNDSCSWNLIPTYQLLIMTNKPHAELVLFCTSKGNYLCFISGTVSIFVYESKYSVILLKVFPILQSREFSSCQRIYHYPHPCGNNSYKRDYMSIIIWYHITRISTSSV